MPTAGESQLSQRENESSDKRGSRCRCSSDVKGKKKNSKPPRRSSPSTLPLSFSRWAFAYSLPILSHDLQMTAMTPSMTRRRRT